MSFKVLLRFPDANTVHVWLDAHPLVSRDGDTTRYSNPTTGTAFALRVEGDRGTLELEYLRPFAFAREAAELLVQLRQACDFTVDGDPELDEFVGGRFLATDLLRGWSRGNLRSCVLSIQTRLADDREDLPPLLPPQPNELWDLAFVEAAFDQIESDGAYDLELVRRHRAEAGIAPPPPAGFADFDDLRTFIRQGALQSGARIIVDTDEALRLVVQPDGVRGVVQVNLTHWEAGESEGTALPFVMFEAKLLEAGELDSLALDPAWFARLPLHPDLQMKWSEDGSLTAWRGTLLSGLGPSTFEDAIVHWASIIHRTRIELRGESAPALERSSTTMHVQPVSQEPTESDRVSSVMPQAARKLRTPFALVDCLVGDAFREHTQHFFSPTSVVLAFRTGDERATPVSIECEHTGAQWTVTLKADLETRWDALPAALRHGGSDLFARLARDGEHAVLRATQPLGAFDRGMLVEYVEYFARRARRLRAWRSGRIA